MKALELSMHWTEYLQGFLFGCLGGFFVEILGLYKIRTLEPRKRPNYYKTGFFWACTILMICCGGILVTLYLGSGISITPILATNVGVSAPLTLGALADRVPDISPGKIDIEASETSVTEQMSALD